ncbi:cyclic nucleotide-binding domain-containing protein [archaeon]|nr:cyclic nucleotide-binding domain-containing protein [archaeon]
MNLVKETYEPNKIIVKEGDTGGCLYILKEGEVDCVLKNQTIRTLSKGESFGEISILLDSPRTMDVIAKTHCVLYSISVDTFRKLVGEMYREIIIYNFITNAFDRSENFGKIEPSLLENTFPTFKVSHYKKHDVVLSAGYQYQSKILILAEGNLLNVNY